MIPEMASLNHKVPDAPGFSPLGLDLDQRMRYTVPHPAHTCHATGSPCGTEPSRHSMYCPSRNFIACAMHLAWQRRTGIGRTPKSPRSDERASMRPSGTAPTSAAPRSQVINIFRAGDALARIASVNGLSVELVAAANHLASSDEVGMTNASRSKLRPSPLRQDSGPAEAGLARLTAPYAMANDPHHRPVRGCRCFHSAARPKFPGQRK